MKFKKYIFITTIVFSLNLFAKAKDGEWVILEGMVTKSNPDYFILENNDKKTIIEMDDWDWYKEGYKILKGDNVIVNGRVDHDFMEKRKIEASSVYVKELNTHYFASSDDEELRPYFNGFYFEVVDMPDNLNLQFTGIVESIEDNNFILNTGKRKFNVDVEGMSYDPFKNENYSTVKIGDKIRVYGDFEDNFFSLDEIKARWIVTLNNRG